MIWSIALLAAVTLERLGELWLAKRNTEALLARGAVEVASSHYLVIVILHAAWLVGLWLLGWSEQLHMGWFAVFVGLQFLRIWTLSTLGRRWTTRIIVVPGEELVRTGPYRFLRHPNYVVVIGEIAVLPLCFGLGLFAVIFSAANALILAVRIRAENRALSGASNVSQR
ncbi:isoprenylcysteine carboxyl methyltransferase family protein [Agrobacterium sp. rho-8.1]|nr:isoprenylcysteine carboxylmethyltransferase family protein [Agrobacterium sp. rho-8.1]